jgi:hypothetical protein
MWDLNEVPESKAHDGQEFKIDQTEPSQSSNQHHFGGQEIFPAFHHLTKSRRTESITSSVSKKKQPEGEEFEVPNVGFNLIPGHHGSVISSASICHLT